MQNQTSGAEWMTVKQFAVASGCTTQAIYKQLATRLQPYVKKENGRTLLHSSGLNATKLQPVDNPQQVDNQLQTGAAAAEAAALDALRDQISRQAAELDAVRAQLDHVRTELNGTRLDRSKAEAQRDAARAELAEAQQRAADAEARERATAEAAAERERAADQRAAEAAERDRAAAQQLANLAEALKQAQTQAAELTSALATAHALQAGQIQLAMQQGAADQPGDGAQQTVRTAEQPQPDSSTRSAQQPAGADQRGDDQSGAADADQQPKRRGLFARLFRKNK